MLRRRAWRGAEEREGRTACARGDGPRRRIGVRARPRVDGRRCRQAWHRRRERRAGLSDRRHPGREAHARRPPRSRRAGEARRPPRRPDLPRRQRRDAATVSAAAARAQRAVTVFTNRAAPLSTRGYSQRIPTSGYGYLTTRDGTKLAIDVHTPGHGQRAVPDARRIRRLRLRGSRPGPDSGIAQVANLLGFAVVDVNMRGTGCSGGAFDYFERLQGLDGYDIIETVARQPWVLHHKVGMMGISYGGISQLFVAATDPPHLAAIAPLSVIDDSATTLYPGGILNTGFTLPWAAERDHDALPASTTGGQPWVLKEIQGRHDVQGATRRSTPRRSNLVDKIQREPRTTSRRSPIRSARSSSSTRSGCRCIWPASSPTSRPAATAPTSSRTSPARARSGSRSPTASTPTRLIRRRSTAGTTSSSCTWRSEARRCRRGQGERADRSTRRCSGIRRRHAAERSDPVRAELRRRARRLPAAAAGPRPVRQRRRQRRRPGTRCPASSRRSRRFPIPGTQARSWYLGASGHLTDAKPTESRTGDNFTWNKTARPPTDFTGNTDGGAGRLWNATPPYHWTQNPAGTAVSYVSAPLAREPRCLGGGRGPGVDQVRDAGRRSPGDGHRGPPRRQGDVCPERLAAGERAQARPAGSSLLAPAPDIPPRRRRAAAKRHVHRRHGPALLRGPRLPQGLARSGSSSPRPSGDNPIWAFRNTVPSSGTDKIFIAPLAVDAVTARAPGRARRVRADRRCRRARACAASRAGRTCRPLWRRRSAQKSPHAGRSGSAGLGRRPDEDLVDVDVRRLRDREHHRPRDVVGVRGAPVTGLSKNGVSTMPGSISVTRTPVSPSSWRSALAHPGDRPLRRRVQRSRQRAAAGDRAGQQEMAAGLAASHGSVARIVSAAP